MAESLLGRLELAPRGGPRPTELFSSSSIDESDPSVGTTEPPCYDREEAKAKRKRKRIAIMSVRIRVSPIDLTVIVIYILGCTALGGWLGSGTKGLQGYFLGERNIPAWAVMISIVATETSTATFLSVPGVAYKGDLTYLQLPMGYLIGRVIVATLLLPSYFRGRIETAYQVLGNRFGDATRRTASLLFLAHAVARRRAETFPCRQGASIHHRLADLDGDLRGRGGDHRLHLPGRDEGRDLGRRHPVHHLHLRRVRGARDPGWQAARRLG